MELSGLDKGEGKEELEELAKDFAVNKVTASGISYIVSSPSRIRRFLWFVAVMACIIFMSYMTTKVVLEYLEYPKVLIKEDTILPRLPFPAVTICSLNTLESHYVSETSLRKLFELNIMMKNVTTERLNASVRDNCYANPLCNWSWFHEQCVCAKNPCLTELCPAEDKKHCNCPLSFCTSTGQVEGCQIVPDASNSNNDQICRCQGLSNQGRDGMQMEKKDIQDLLASIENKEVSDVIRLIKESQTDDLVDIEEALMPSIHELYDYGVYFDNLVVSCSFEGEPCFPENFTMLHDPNYGKCYMFNYVGNNTSSGEQPIEIHRYGSATGLRLLLRVSDDNVLDILQNEIGARVVIHDPHMLPFVSEYGVNVRPKDMTAIQVSHSKIYRLGKPWGNCEEGTKRVFDGDCYSILGCEKYCGYKYMTENCNCTLRHFLPGSVTKLEPDYHLCDISDEKQKRCALEIEEEYEKDLNCDCRPPCRENIYSYTVTSSELNDAYYKSVKDIRTLNLTSAGQRKYTSYYEQTAMVGLKVYYNTLQVSNHTEVASYSWETLMANIGGNLGFFMGLTLVTFLEITEFIWDFVKTACSFKK